MSASFRRAQESEDLNDRAPSALEAAETVASALDWQALLLRYLPQRLGSEHAVKRILPR